MLAQNAALKVLAGTGQGWSITSSDSAGATFGRPSHHAATETRDPGTWSLGCDCQPGSERAKWVACWPVPVAVSSIQPLAGSKRLCNEGPTGLTCVNRYRRGFVEHHGALMCSARSPSTDLWSRPMKTLTTAVALAFFALTGATAFAAEPAKPATADKAKPAAADKAKAPEKAASAPAAAKAATAAADKAPAKKEKKGGC
jgi:hypothetical protein